MELETYNNLTEGIEKTIFIQRFVLKYFCTTILYIIVKLHTTKV